MYGAKMSIVTTCGRLSRLFAFGFLSLVLSTSVASAQYCTPDQCDECNLCQCSQSCCHELPELWLINTRCAPRCRNLDNGFECLTYKRYDRMCCRWVRESRESFLAQESSKPTLFYSHGNSLNHKNAMKSCWSIYCKMRCCPGPKRLVFWSWPAERVYKTEGLRVRKMIEKNLRIKYVYAEYQGYYMAKLVNQMSLSKRVMMSGHSYGGITAAAAAHYIGGGCLRGLVLEGGAPVERPNLRAAVISGAFDHDMLNPGNRYGQTFVAAEKVYVTRNIKDRTLKKWPKTSWRNRRAIGVLGVNANCLGEYRNKLCQQTMTSDVGTSHYLKPHLKSVRFVAALCCLSFPKCDDCQVAGSEEVPPSEVITDEQLAAEEDSVVGSDQPDVALVDYTEEVADLTMLKDDGLTELDWAEVFAGESYAQSVPTANLSQLAPLNNRLQLDATERTLGLQEPLFVRPQSAAPQQTELQQTTVSQTPATQPPQATAALGTHGSGSSNLWVHSGVGLALVLSGPLYILFSNRSSSS